MLEMEKRKAKKILKEKLRTKKSAMFTSQPFGKHGNCSRSCAERTRFRVEVTGVNHRKSMAMLQRPLCLNTQSNPATPAVKMSIGNPLLRGNCRTDVESHSLAIEIGREDIWRTALLRKEGTSLCNTTPGCTRIRRSVRCHHPRRISTRELLSLKFNPPKA